MRRASPLARRAIPNCQTDGSLPGAEPVLLPSTPAPPPSPSAPAPSPPLYGEPPAPRADRPRKSRLYWKINRDYRLSTLYIFSSSPSILPDHGDEHWTSFSIDTSDQKYFGNAPFNYSRASIYRRHSQTFVDIQSVFIALSLVHDLQVDINYVSIRVRTIRNTLLGKILVPHC